MACWFCGRVLGLSTQETLIASNPFSRAWQYLKSPFLFRSEGRHRIQLLRLCADMFYRVLDFENAVLTPDIKHMPKSINAFQNLRYAFDIAQKSFAVFLTRIRKKESIRKVLLIRQGRGCCKRESRTTRPR